MAALKESDLRLFVDSVSRYFDVTSRITPEITSAFLGVGTLPGHDFNGIVSFSGRFIGHVIVSLPAAALKELLLVAGALSWMDHNFLLIIIHMTELL